MKRRSLLRTTSLVFAAGSSTAFAKEAGSSFGFRYLLASSMYGNLKLDAMLPEVIKTGAEYIDFWPRRHGTQREQVEEMGHEAFGKLLKKHQVKLGCSTRFDLGPFKLQDEMKIVAKFGGDLLVCAGQGPRNLKGAALKAAAAKFAEQLKPQAEAAAEANVCIGIENHSSNLINAPDPLKWLADMTGNSIGISQAPYHLETHQLGGQGNHY